jgi:hypothetical protein
MRKYPHNLPPQVEYINDNVIRKTAWTSLANTIEFIEALCNHLICHPDPMIVPIYAFENQGYQAYSGRYRYTYDMQALLLLQPEEKRLINRVANIYECAEELPSQSKDQKIKEGWINYPELMKFLDKVVSMGRYRDLHDGNIMIDEFDNYQIIDIEGFIYGNLEDSNNAWITRK